MPHQQHPSQKASHICHGLLPSRSKVVTVDCGEGGGGRPQHSTVDHIVVHKGAGQCRTTLHGHPQMVELYVTVDCGHARGKWGGGGRSR